MPPDRPIPNTLLPAGCCIPGGNKAVTAGVEFSPAPVFDTGEPTPTAADARRPGSLVSTDPQWRAESQKKRKVIPAGYTYLAQLLGHDMGSSVPLRQVPYVEKATIGPSGQPVRYNLIENPLTLETVYGPGPTMLPHLFDQTTFEFRIRDHARLATVYKLGLPAETETETETETKQIVRALYDDRNRDTLMLHQLTAAWMRFHNRVARALKKNQSVDPLSAYELARAHCVRTWHDIVRHDILPQFVMDDIMKLSPPLPAAWVLPEVSLLHGLFRAFHSLPLGHYQLTVQNRQSIQDLLKASYLPSQAEQEDWAIDWQAFLAPVDAPIAVEGYPRPFTGVCFSADPRLQQRGHRHVIILDALTQAQTHGLRITGQAIQAALIALKQRCGFEGSVAPDALVEAIGKYRHAPKIDAAGIRKASLAEVLMAEAQVHGPGGKFGPLGSALLRGSVEAALGRVVLAEEELPTAIKSLSVTLPRPKTMLELIQLVEE